MSCRKLICDNDFQSMGHVRWSGGEYLVGDIEFSGKVM